LTDALCDRIIRSEMRPRFRENDYFGGIEAAIDAIFLATKGEYTSAGKGQNASDWIPVMIIIFVILFSMISAIRGRKYTIGSRGHRSYNNWWWGGGGFGGGGFGSFGGGGGGGWSAGGGSFGGGGARGSW
jgi:uncharacterized protein